MLSLTSQTGLPYREIKDLFGYIEGKFGGTYPDEEKDYTAVLARTMFDIGYWPIDWNNSEYDANRLAVSTM